MVLQGSTGVTPTKQHCYFSVLRYQCSNFAIGYYIAGHSDLAVYFVSGSCSRCAFSWWSCCCAACWGFCCCCCAALLGVLLMCCFFWVLFLCCLGGLVTMLLVGGEASCCTACWAFFATFSCRILDSHSSLEPAPGAFGQKHLPKN